MNSNEPFDQAAYDAPDTMPRTRDGRADVAGVAAKRRRESTLHLHTNRTIEAGLKILAGPSTSETTWKAVALLTKAEPRYRKLGGKIPYWKDGISRAGHRAGPK
jgi:hypothetical protein